MRAIYKYQVPVDGQIHDYSIPTGAIVRHVDQQGNYPHLWVEVQSDAPTVTRTFRVFGTGHPIPDGFVYVGSTMDGPFVWHVFEQL